ncbi:adenylate/guanylate cyclase domain-containing protein [Bradyrhizobium sp. NP1]|uniref:adenylate/guanylate cyclase domain-containing protein n=1 Tax=Bradyrhizobium sp. NP1 TaxID=3049772 RepID=UPI0025A60483|nr:adenylate/guanylate cyclase domain-containing protein [Bradyrhizobium sp. NP1]WJR80845.1 adenylate/guanylate cyclase domain-containing protein [Bradyrhizobium sp. NP1]
MPSVRQWLASLGLSEYADRFAEHRIDFSILRDLTDKDIKEELGIVPLGDRRRLLRAIAELAGTASTTAKPAPGPESSPRDEAERRQVTVMFADLVGSTALSTGMDPEDLREVISAYQKCVADTVRHFGGFVARYVGDGVLVYFGYPQAHEDDAERAVRAGLELIAVVAGLKTRAPQQVRVGIATGVVVVGHLIPSGESEERGMVGETPNLAARLQSIAGPNMVVVAESTRRLLGGFFQLDDLGMRSLKGIAGQVRAWAVLQASSVASRFEALHATGLTALVGREKEFELLRRRFFKATGGKGQVVLLSGEAGIGKSRLTSALVGLLADEPHIRLRYSCSPQHTDSVFYPFIGQIERAAGLAREDTARAKLDKLDGLLKQTSTSAQDAALFAAMLSLPNDQRYPAVELTPPQRRQRTLQAVALQVEALARSCPVLMIFEDAHWSDPSSLELLGRVVDRLRTLSVLLIVTFRPEFEPGWVGKPYVTSLSLNRLAPREVGAIIDHIVGNKPLPANIRQDIIERTDGIPLFVEEMTKAVLEAESESEAQRTAALVPPPALAVPASLHASLMARLDRLGPGKELAQIGAAIGREFSHSLLAAVVRKPEAELQAALDRLIAAGLLLRQGGTPQATYSFKHVLVRDVAYSTLLREPRRALHARIAETLENHFTEISASQPELIARHYREADDVVKAVSYLSVAGDRALSHSALKEAHEHITQALQLISALPDDDIRRRGELKLQTALARTLQELKGYADQQVGEAYTKAHEFSKRVGDAGLHLAALYGLWAYQYLSGQPGPMLEQANEFLAFAVREDEAGAIMVGYRLVGTSRLINGYIADASDALDQAFVRYDPDEHSAASPAGRSLRARFGHDVGVTMYSYRSWALWLSGRPADAAMAAEGELERGHALEHDDQSRLYALWHAGMTYVLLRNVDKVAEIGSQLTELADDRQLPYWQALGDFLCGWRAMRAGRAGDAVGLLQDGLRIWAQTGSRIFRPICLAFLAEAYAADEKPDLAHRTFEEALRTASETGERWAEPEIHRLFGDLLARRGPSAAAIANYEQAVAVARGQRSRSFELRATTSLARVLSDQGRHAEAHERLLNIYQFFDAGCDAPDLADAKALLDELPSTSRARGH